MMKEDKTYIIGDDGDREWLCDHNVGHSKNVHTCDGCCNKERMEHKMSLKMDGGELHLDEIQCEEEDDGTLTLNIPDELVRKIVEFTIINALEKLVKEYETN